MIALMSNSSLMLPDCYYRDGKKAVNSLYHFCSTDPQFLSVVDWSLIATDLYIGENGIKNNM